MSEQPLWYAVHVRSNREQQVRQMLDTAGLTCFLPCYRVRSSRHDRVVYLIKPLFPGYLFVRVPLHSPERIRVLRTPGVVRLVGFGAEPTPVAPEVMNTLMIVAGKDDQPVRPHPLIAAGQPVRVVAGPFCGAVGVLSAREGRPSRLVVELAFLGRAVAVPISADEVAPVFADQAP